VCIVVYFVDAPTFQLGVNIGKVMSTPRSVTHLMISSISFAIHFTLMCRVTVIINVQVLVNLQ